MEKILSYNTSIIEMIEMTSIKTNPKVSIITPSLNKAAFVEKTINSVFSQDYKNIEHIVIDGGSTDGTLDILRRYKHLVLISEPDNGQTQAINKGFRMATGQILTWLNADDMLLQGAVSEAVKAFKEYPYAHFIYGDFQVLDEYSRKITFVKVVDYDRNILIYGRNLINQPASFFKKEVLDLIGYLDEGLNFCMDYDLWVRAALAGLTFVNIRLPLAAIHLYKGSKMMDFTGKLLTETRTILNNNKLLWLRDRESLNKVAFFSLHYFYKAKCAIRRAVERKEIRFITSMAMARKRMRDIEKEKRR